MERPGRVRVPGPRGAGGAQPGTVVVAGLVVMMVREVVVVVRRVMVVVVLVVVMLGMRTILQVRVDVELVAAGVAVHHEPDVGRRDCGAEAQRDQGGEAGPHGAPHRPPSSGDVASEYGSCPPAGCIVTASGSAPAFLISSGSGTLVGYLRRGQLVFDAYAHSPWQGTVVSVILDLHQDLPILEVYRTMPSPEGLADDDFFDL